MQEAIQQGVAGASYDFPGMGEPARWDARSILIIETTARHHQKFLALFGDGHTELLDAATRERTLKMDRNLRSNDQ